MATNGHTNGAEKSSIRSNLLPVADRLEEGRALAQDVWSIFKYVCAFASERCN